jgi:hypothetical protein
MRTPTAPVEGTAGGSVAARRTFEILFATTPTPVMRSLHRRGVMAPIQEIRVVGRRTGIEHAFLAVVVELDGAMYIGHPNGRRAQWVRNLLHAGQGTVVRPDGSMTAVRATELPPGPERTTVIDAHRAVQRQPFRTLYGRTREHIVATGTYFRLDPTD